MPDQPSEFMTTREARQLADSLARYGGKQSPAVRVASMERDCARAARLIRAMLRQVHSSDVFQLPPEDGR
jgi:hypothetical protein